ncbi:MAG: ATP-binding protein [Polyangiaceae bacterium]
MARSDLLISLVRAGAQGDKPAFTRTVEAIIAEERARQHNVLADRLAENLRVSGVERRFDAPRPTFDMSGFLHELTPRRELEELLLPDVAQVAMQEIIEEHQRVDLLRAHGLEPRHRVLLAGPPGNGKTTLAEAIATALLVPLLVVRYEGVIASYLGETAVRIGRLFEYARARRCVLFFDEFDAVAKERGDVHETGEIKRVVSSLLLQVDALPSHVVVVAATNHAELLDRAVWRRFQLRIALPKPNSPQVEEWFRRFEIRAGFRLGIPTKTLAERLKGLSFAELEDFGADVQRRYVLGLPSAEPTAIVRERLAQWGARFTGEE